MTPTTDQPQSHRRVTVSPLGLKYHEDDRVLEFTTELGTDSRGSFYYVYVWSAQAWPRRMPEWCRDRREEILSYILEATKGKYRLQWVEMQ
jgi:hypothetical protein